MKNNSLEQTKIECQDCGGKLRKIGSTVSNNHDFIDTQCVDCKTVIQVVLGFPYTRDELERFMKNILPFRRLYQTSDETTIQIFDSSDGSKKHE